ncbi:hypothetical protein ACFOEK_19935 [Litoribrevibacter euphylliae]|uniref:Uncharacterized protein n=1 Tax=Litoribrevibacter euphylliae TaxID=1834034 RepID=A0ABV7HKZ7_9GAMM
MEMEKLIKLSSEDRYIELLGIQEDINRNLKQHFIDSRYSGREYLASTLLKKINEIVDEFKSKGFELYSIDYCGSTEYESSEQWFGPGYTQTGMFLHFWGYSVQVIWEDSK